MTNSNTSDYSDLGITEEYVTQRQADNRAAIIERRAAFNDPSYATQLIKQLTTSKTAYVFAPYENKDQESFFSDLAQLLERSSGIAGASKAYFTPYSKSTLVSGPPIYETEDCKYTVTSYKDQNRNNMHVGITVTRYDSLDDERINALQEKHRPSPLRENLLYLSEYENLVPLTWVRVLRDKIYAERMSAFTPEIIKGLADKAIDNNSASFRVELGKDIPEDFDEMADALERLKSNTAFKIVSHQGRSVFFKFTHAGPSPLDLLRESANRQEQALIDQRNIKPALLPKLWKIITKKAVQLSQIIRPKSQAPVALPEPVTKKLPAPIIPQADQRDNLLKRINDTLDHLKPLVPSIENLNADDYTDLTNAGAQIKMLLEADIALRKRQVYAPTYSTAKIVGLSPFNDAAFKLENITNTVEDYVLRPYLQTPEGITALNDMFKEATRTLNGVAQAEIDKQAKSKSFEVVSYTEIIRDTAKPFMN